MARKNSDRKNRSEEKFDQSPHWDFNFDGRDRSDERLPTALLVVPMDSADLNIFITLLFLI
jgi:hypothetical protein